MNLVDAAMVKPAVCPIASTYNLLFEGEEILLDASSRTFGRIACPAADTFPRSVSSLMSRRPFACAGRFLTYLEVGCP